MVNFISEIPFKLPINLVATCKSETETYTDYSLYAVQGKRRLPIARLTVFLNNDAYAIKSLYIRSEYQRDTWQKVVEALGGRADLSCSSVTYEHDSGEHL